MRCLFLSTLSLRRATTNRRTTKPNLGYFYPRSPCGERLPYVYILVNTFLISIHALLAESDNPLKLAQTSLIISIHALLAESDQQDKHRPHHEGEFLSTLSLRRATFNTMQIVIIVIFLSTLSLRRATTSAMDDLEPSTNFYPRSPCGERLVTAGLLMCNLYFYPRSPCGERRQVKQTCRAKISISIHALLAESDPNFG